MAADYDHVVIDGPPHTTEVTRSALLAADLVLIPVQPSPYDVWACAYLVAPVKECSVFFWIALTDRGCWWRLRFQKTSPWA